MPVNYPIIYSVFLRNFSSENPLKKLESYLPVLKKLGVDTVWFLPIHPTGEIRRKGKLGSPYAIRDYKAVDPSIGTMDDFLKLIRLLKQKGFRTIMDLVLHHASPDNPIFADKKFIHPGFKESKLSESWQDIVKFNFNEKKLYDILLDIMDFWLEKGIAGFRCDVASLVPADFWQAATGLFSKKYPDALFLAETLSMDFYLDHVSHDSNYTSDFNIAQFFSYLYAYNAYYQWQQYLAGQSDLKQLILFLNYENQFWGQSSRRCYFIENHDTPRAASYLNAAQWKLWFFFFALQPGAFMMYNGQEAGLSDKISLFDHAPIQWEKSNPDLLEWITKAMDTRNRILRMDSFSFLYNEENNCIYQKIVNVDGTTHIYYNVSPNGFVISTPVPEKEFINGFDHRLYSVHNHKVNLPAYTALVIPE